MRTIINNAMHHRYRTEEERTATDDLVFSAAAKAGTHWKLKDLHELLEHDLVHKLKIYTVPKQRAFISETLYRLRRTGRLVFNGTTQYWSVSKRKRSQ